MKKISAFLVILALFLFIFTIIGMELFANTIRLNYDNEPIPYYSGELVMSNSYPAYNFDSFGDAVVTVFVVLANDGWSTIFYDHARVNGQVISSIFFIGVVVLG